MWISFHCDPPILEDPGKSGKTGGPIPQKVYKVQYSPSFGVRIFRKFFALAATTLFLVPLCSLWSWSKKSDSLYQCILEKHKVTKWFNRKFDFLSTNLLEVGEDSITALFLQLFQCWQPMGCRKKLASRDTYPVHKMRPPVCSYSVKYQVKIKCLSLKAWIWMSVFWLRCSFCMHWHESTIMSCKRSIEYFSF